MKKRVGSIVVILVLACAIVALYLYIDRSGKQAKEQVSTAAEQVLARNMEANYPPTPHAVAEFYCNIVECIYSEETTESQIEALVAKELLLFDEEFAAQNPYEQYLLATKEELSAAKEKELVFTGYVLDKASNVEKWKKDGVEYASLQLQFMSRSKEGNGANCRNLILRKDEQGRYKILGWKILTDMD